MILIIVSVTLYLSCLLYYLLRRDRRGRDRMIVKFTTTCALSDYHHLSCEFEPCSWGGVRNTTLCDKVCH